MNTYGPEGGYTKGMGMKEKYHSWAAAQYREKVRTMLAHPLLAQRYKHDDEDAHPDYLNSCLP